MRTLLVLVVATAALTGCLSGARVVSHDLAKYELPYLGRQSALVAVRDWRQLAHPTPAVREYFGTQRSTYRVVSAQPDRVTLAVWKTDSPYGQPFDGGEQATGHGCVTLTRTTTATTRWEYGSAPVHAQVVPCPPRLGPAPDPDRASWGRDSDAVDAAHDAITSVDFAVTAVFRHGPYAPTPLRTAGDVLAAIRATRSPGLRRVTVTPSGDQPPGRVRARGSVDATAHDVVDTGRTARARACFVADVSLVAAEPEPDVRPVPCP